MIRVVAEKLIKQNKMNMINIYVILSTVVRKKGNKT